MHPVIRYGVVGCGMMGQEHLRNIALLGNAVVTRIFEPNGAMAERSLALAPGAQRAASLAQLVCAEDVDCVLLASPNFQHAPQVQALAALRTLPLLLEKPACTRLEEVRSLAALLHGYGAPIWVAMEYRYMPPVQRLAELLHQPSSPVGRLHMLSMREHRFPFLEKVDDWNRFNRYTGGTLVEKCCHFFDLMRYLTQSEPVRIYASASAAHNHLDERYPQGVPDIWDNAYVVVDFASGQRALLELCMFAEGARYQEEIVALGSQGKLECLVPGPGRFWPAHLGPAPLPQIVMSPRHPKGPQVQQVPVDAHALAAGDHNGATLYQHQRFRDAVCGLGSVEVGLRDGLVAVVMGLAAQVSAQTGQAVDLTQGDFDLRAF